METVAPFKEVIEEIKENGADAVKLCYQYGKCDTVCPWNTVRKFSMRKLIREAAFGLTEIESEEIYCCGESIRKTGDEELFKRLAKENIKTWIDHGVKKILVSSPHCYHTLKNEYPDFNVHFEIVHISEFLFQLINEGKLEISKEYAKKVIYHDPCYLGRHNGIYDEPRGVLNQIPGLKLSEFSESREESLCCGMGGGRIWMETPKSERFANLKIDEAVELGAEVLVTSCPYCITSFEESRLVMNHDEAIQIKYITEILQEVLE